MESSRDKKERLRNQRVVKLLLYGTGECGKTTILRRVMLNHGNSLTEERLAFKPKIILNVIEGAYIVIRTARFRFQYDFTKVGESKTMNNIKFVVSEEDSICAKRIIHAYTYFNQNANFSNFDESPLGYSLPSETEGDLQKPHGPAVVHSILHFLDTNEFFKNLVKRRNQFSLYENWTYFADRLREFPAWGGERWTPSEEDLLYSRVRTTGLNMFEFTVDQNTYNLIDVGGQRMERIKFFDLFSSVDCVLFVTSLSDYNESLFEDYNENRLKESLVNFRETASNESFKDTWFILFFNKFDSFKEKYYDQRIPINIKTIKGHSELFSAEPPTVDKEKDQSCKLALAWYEKIFTDLVPPAKRHQIRPYVTSCIQNNNINEVMDLSIGFLWTKLLENAPA